MSNSPLNQLVPSWDAETLQGFDIPENVQDGQRIGGSSKRQFVRFYKKKLAEPYATEVKIHPQTGATQVLKTGVREVEREFVHVRTPGDKNEIETFAEDDHRREFFHQYRAYRDGKGIPLGTPVEECNYIAPSIQTELVYLGIRTEEQLADASEIALERIPDGFSLREFARANCKVKFDNAASGQVNLLKSEMLKLQETIKAQAQQMETLKALVNPQGEPLSQVVSEVLETEKRGRGRPKKLDLEA